MRERLAALRGRVRNGVEAAFEGGHTPHEVAASFAFGVFVAAMPTGGTALVLFVAVAYFVERASKLALAAALVVFNPIVKWSVYGASFWLGSRLLGPVPGLNPGDVTVTDLSLSAGREVIVRQLLGNTILAVAAAVVGYVGVRWTLRVYRDHGTDDHEGEHTAQ